MTRVIDLKKVRKLHNEDLIARMKKGEALNKFDSYASWFPERPVIKKDTCALNFIHRSGRRTKKNEKTNLRAFKKSS